MVSPKPLGSVGELGCGEGWSGAQGPWPTVMPAHPGPSLRKCHSSLKLCLLLTRNPQTPGNLGGSLVMDITLLSSLSLLMGSVEVTV